MLDSSLFGQSEHKVEYPSQDRLRERVSLGTSMELLLVNLMKSYDVSEAYPTVGPGKNGPMIRNEEHVISTIDQALKMRQTWAASTWVGFKTCVPWSILRHMGNGHPFHILGTFNGWMKIGPGCRFEFGTGKCIPFNRTSAQHSGRRRPVPIGWYSDKHSQQHLGILGPL